MEPESLAPASVPAVRAAALGESDVVTVLQPIVSLDNEDVVGFEALSRWPGVSGPSVEMVFAWADAHGVASQLDRRCTRAAAAAALAAQLPSGTLLLINTEPTTGAPITAHDASLTEVFGRHRLVFELTERELLKHPRALLRKLAALREAGVGIALDDVGADPDVLAWLEVLDPTSSNSICRSFKASPPPRRPGSSTRSTGFTNAVVRSSSPRASKPMHTSTRPARWAPRSGRATDSVDPPSAERSRTRVAASSPNYHCASRRRGPSRARPTTR